MSQTSWIAAALAPTLGVAFWWLVKQPGKGIVGWLERKLPPRSLLRRILLKRVS